MQPTNQIVWIVNWLFHYQNLIGDVNIWRPDPVTEPRLTFQTDKTNVFTPLKSLQECNFDFVPVQTCKQSPQLGVVCQMGVSESSVQPSEKNILSSSTNENFSIDTPRIWTF